MKRYGWFTWPLTARLIEIKPMGNQFRLLLFKPKKKHNDKGFCIRLHSKIMQRI